VLNPSLQRERFDPTGAYVTRYVSERAGPDGTLPGMAGPDMDLGPDALVDHAAERSEALARFAEARRPPGHR
jgi:deoxyribodipyrimidine photo-lyase